MPQTLRKLLRPLWQQNGPAIPQGERVYAIGDVHGRLDLFAALANAIEADDAARGSADTTVILLGDLIDRGPDSASVVAAARAWQYRRKVRIICGNHEEMFLGSFHHEETLRHFLRHGGKETLLSYPIIALPCTAMMMGLMWWLAREAKQLTGLDFGDMLHAA